MIKYVSGDIFEAPSQVLVNSVNTVGVMGKGIAFWFKKLYPEMFKDYQIFCDNGSLDIGKLFIYKTQNKWVLNFPTKKHWRGKSKLEYIELGLQKFVETYKEKGITSISFPRLGCGNGGLDWESEVKPLMVKYLDDLDIDVYIYLYNKIQEEKEYIDIDSMKKWLRESPQELSYKEVRQDIIDFIASNTIMLEGKLQKIEFTSNSFVSIAGIKVSNEIMMYLWREMQHKFILNLDSDTFISQTDSSKALILELFRVLPYVKEITIYDSSIEKTLLFVPPMRFSDVQTSWDFES